MKANPYEAAKQILGNYLVQNNCRKTPERFAVLEAVYAFGSYFSIQDLSDKLESMNFPVCRATLYNALKLFASLRLVMSLRMPEGLRYRASYSDNKCVQVCVVCGNVKEVKVPELTDVIDRVHLKRFRKENFSTYIYGTCSTCQGMLTRKMKKEKTNKQE